MEDMRMRVFLDANVLFSASDLRSETARNLMMLLNHGHEAVTNPYAWEEAWRNIKTKYPHWLSGLERLRDAVAIIDIPAIVDIECEAKDKPILAGAVGARCTHLWTGDKTHFGMFFGRKICGVTVVSSLQLTHLLARG